MPNSDATTLRATYAAAFRCIGQACEDHCCGDWDIPLDRDTFTRYRQFPPDQLGTLVSHFVIVNPPPQAEASYAHIQRGSGGLCPFFEADHLCGIQKEYGAPLLSMTCSLYPRALNRVENQLEGSLSLSCPEAARNVLLDPQFMRVQANLLSGDFRTDNIFDLTSDHNGSPHKPLSPYLEIRATIIHLLTDRSHPLSFRLLLLGHLCLRLDEIIATQGAAAIPAFLEDFRSREDSALRAGLERLPSNPRLKLEVIFELSDALLREGARPRFQQTFWDFIEGIGTPLDGAPGDDLERFRNAEAQYHAPFFETSPFLLENYLLNYIFQHLFPYGRAGTPSQTSTLFEEYLQMTTQFAWVNALLVGVAGSHKGAFAAPEVIQTIQSFTRTVEHYPAFLKSIATYIRSRGLSSLAGMAVILKS